MNDADSNVLIGKADRDEKGLFYDYYLRITLAEINVEGTMSHDQFARLFGKARELFALECIPGFAASMGRAYLLQTRTASYDFAKAVRFADLIIVKMRVLKVGNSSFELGGEFINAKTKEICATGKQVIIYTDLKGVPTNIPDTLRNILFDSLQPAKSP